LCFGSWFALITPALSGFYAGRGKTKTVFQINIIGIIANVILDYILIFGNFGFPELGITGAALASICASVIMDAIFIFLIFSKKNARKYGTRNIKPDIDFIKRLFKFGFPNGIQFFFDMSSFTFFVIVIGTLGRLELSATNIALNINHLFFMPLVGCGITTSILVGNYLGKNKASIAVLCVKTAVKTVSIYMGAVILAFIFIPNVFIYPFSKGSEALIIEQIRPMTINLLRFVALYSLFDPLNIIFASAVKGAGDTAFVMKFASAAAVFIWAIPLYLVVVVFNLGVYAGWSVTVIYALICAAVFYLRYRTNKWKKMRVIKMEIIDG